VKVLMTADTVGGVWTYALELARALPDVRFVLATFGPLPTPTQRSQAARLDNVTLDSRASVLEWQAGCEASLADDARWLRSLAARHRPDLAHLNGYAHARVPFGCPVLVVAHSCVVTWWLAVHGTAPPPEWDAYRARIGAAFERADCVVAPTHAFLRDLIAAHGKPRRAYAIYNGRGAPDATATTTEARRARVVLAAGRLWDEAKNLRVLEAAAPQLSVPVCVAGARRGPDGGGPVTQAVTALGELTPGALSRFMRRAAVYASPALYEPFGLAPLEAAIAGCALVLGDIPTLRELWNGAAVFVPPHDPSRLVAAIETLLADPAELDKWAGRARRRAALYSLERMGGAYRAVYRELVPTAARGLDQPEVAFA
jgi:glycogen(starch) synthase